MTMRTLASRRARTWPQPPARCASPTSLVAALVLGALASGGCKGSGAKPTPAPSASASAVPPTSGATSASAIPTSSPAPSGDNGVETFEPIGPACKLGRTDIGEYLQRGELTLAAREGVVAAAWLVQIPKKPTAQIAFASYDADAKQVARGRSVGSAREHAPRIFVSGPDFTVAWFDEKGLAYARPKRETLPSATIEHLGAVASDDADDVALAVTPSGALVAAAPMGASATQLSLFLFAPVEDGAPPVKAIGVTHHAQKPRRPAIAADAGGYYLAWLDEGGRIASSFFDPSGKESGSSGTIADASEQKRDHLSLAATSSGALAVWEEGGSIRARPLDKGGAPTGAISVIGKGKWATIASVGDGVLVGWVGAEGKSGDTFLVAKVGASGVAASKGLRVTDGVKDPPAVAVAGPRVALAWMEPMGTGVSTKRAALRTIDTACLP